VTAPPSEAEAVRPGELSDAEIVAWARRTRARKGLPAKITDPATIRRLVTLALGPGLSQGRDSGRT
jgi:hypothetical protein